MARRLLPYGFGLVTVVTVAGGLGLIAYSLGITRVESYWAALALAIGAIAWRYGRAPALVALAAVTLVADLFFTEPRGVLDVPNLSEGVRLLIGILASLAAIQFAHIWRRREVLLEQRKDLLQDVSPRILRSLDTEEIFDTVAEATLRVIDYQHLRLYRWDETSDRLILVKSVARAKPYDAIDWHDLTFQLGEGITGAAAQGRKAILVPDAKKDPRMIYPPGTEKIEESVISVPMVTRDRLFGVLTMARLGVDTLSAEDLRLMESIGAQSALALANAEEYAEAQQTIKALAMIESLQAAESGLPDSEVDQRVLGGFVEFAQADLATLRVLQPDGRYHFAAGGGRKWPESSAGTGQPLSASDVAFLADPRLTTYVTDPRTDERLPAWAKRGTERAGVQASIFLPLRAGQRLVGIIGLHWRRPRWFHGEQLGRLQIIAAQTAIALDTRRTLERERSRAEALAELERARREFMQIASHELRTPLTVIRGYASMLEEGSLGELPAAARRALKTLLDKSTEMRVQVERMLLLARLEDSAAPPQMTPLDLRTVVREAIERVKPQVDLKQGEVDVSLADEPLRVLGDPERLGTAVDNLLQNAVKFSMETPHIQVEGGRRDGEVTLVVRDNGIGIPEAARARLFEKFYRVNDPQLHNVAGTGIGLYLVRQVVEGHGGHIAVESRPGEGSAFSIALPAADSH